MIVLFVLIGVIVAVWIVVKLFKLYAWGAKTAFFTAPRALQRSVDRMAGVGRNEDPDKFNVWHDDIGPVALTKRWWHNRQRQRATVRASASERDNLAAMAQHVDAALATPAPAAHQCGRCGAPLTPGVRFCGQCGGCVVD